MRARSKRERLRAVYAPQDEMSIWLEEVETGVSQKVIPIHMPPRRSLLRMVREQRIKWLENRLRRVQEILKAAGILGEDYVDEDLIATDDEQQAAYEPDLGEDQKNYDGNYLEELKEVEQIFGTQPSWHDDGSFPSAFSSMDAMSYPVSGTIQPSSSRCIRSGSATPSSASEDQSVTGEVDSLTSYIFTTNERDEPRYFGKYRSFYYREYSMRLQKFADCYNIGRASPLSIFSANGLQWIRQRTRDLDIPETIFSRPQDENPSKYYPPDVYHDIFNSHVYKPLPSRTEVFGLIKHYFLGANRLFPIYHEASFMQLVEWQYKQQTCKDSALWASINIMIAVAYRYRLPDSMRPERDNEKAWQYFKNALSVLADLTLRRTDLLSAQALLAMVCTLVYSLCNIELLTTKFFRPHFCGEIQDSKRHCHL